VGSDVATVRVCERRALERLGTDADLIAWSLAADPLPAELADEGAVLATLRAIVPAVRQQSAKTVRLPVSRMAGIGTAAAVGVFGLGGVSAAAHLTTILPVPVQNVMHKVVNAPHSTELAKARGADGQGGGEGRTSPSASVVGPGTTAAAEASATTRSAAATAAAVLCRAWAADEVNGVTGDRSAAYRKLVAAAGGEDWVVSYCATMLLAATSAIEEGTSTEPGTKPTWQTQGSESATATPPGIATPSTGTTTPDTTTDTTTPDTSTPGPTEPGPTEPGPIEPGTTAPPDPPSSNDTGHRPSKTKTNTHGPSSSTSGTSDTTTGTTNGSTNGSTNGTTRTKGSTGTNTTTTGAGARAQASDETVPAGSTAGSPRSDSRETGRAPSTTPTN
jgi:hypothetical protein